VQPVYHHCAADTSEATPSFGRLSRFRLRASADKSRLCPLYICVTGESAKTRVSALVAVSLAGEFTA
jgi:hypothetical protein